MGKNNHNRSEVDQIQDGKVIDTHPSMVAAGAAMKVGESSIRKAIQRGSKCQGFHWKKTGTPIEEMKAPSYDWKELEDTASLSGMATNADDLAQKYGVNLNVWEFDRMEIKENKWGVTMGKKSTGKDTPVTKLNPQRYIKVSFKRIKVVFDHKRFAKDLLKEVKEFSPNVEKIKFKRSGKGKFLLEIALCDVHFGKLGWKGETGNLSYDTKIASKRMLECVAAHIAEATSAGKNIERIVFVTGNDFFNSDNDIPFSQTTKGTPQQDDLRWQKTFNLGWKLNVECIELCKEISPVTVVVVPGNHDHQKSFYMGDILHAWFRNDKNVDIRNGADPQKFVEYGNCLIGYCHNMQLARVKLLMQDKVPEAWGRTYFREWHLGDIHHSKKIQLLDEDYQGLMIRWLKSLSGDDGWHNEQGYRSIKGGESFLWDRKYGMTNNFHYNLILSPEDDSERTIRL
jgi:hypothetical protein